MGKSPIGTVELVVKFSIDGALDTISVVDYYLGIWTTDKYLTVNKLLTTCNYGKPKAFEPLVISGGYVVDDR